MPEAAHPLAMVSDLSVRVTFRSPGSAALMAAMHPARPPPTINTSVSTGITLRSAMVSLYLLFLANAPRIWNGVAILIAPFSVCGQSVTQQPQNQHSSGYISMGGSPFFGLGASLSHMQTSTQVLQPVQTSSSK